MRLGLLYFQYFYPDGGWGWIICGVSFLVHVLTTGLQLSYGLLLFYAVEYLHNASGVGEFGSQQKEKICVWPYSECVIKDNRSLLLFSSFAFLVFLPICEVESSVSVLL